MLSPKEPQTSFKFPSTEKLKSKKIIDELFQEGSSFFVYPYKCWYKKNLPDLNQPAQCLFGVPKKSFKKAVDRNYIKRCSREIYRTIFRSTAQELFAGYAIAFVFVGKDKLSYQDQEKKLKLVFNKLQQEALKEV